MSTLSLTSTLSHSKATYGFAAEWCASRLEPYGRTGAGARSFHPITTVPTRPTAVRPSFDELARARQPEVVTLGLASR